MLRLYAQIGVQYYTIYHPDHWRRSQRESSEVYRLENAVYIHQTETPIWMPELELGIGTGIGSHEGLSREWLYWYDQQSNRLPAPESVIAQERQRADGAAGRASRTASRAAEQQFAELLANLKERGIDPNTMR